MNEDDYLQVVTQMRTKSGDLFPLPIVLDIPETLQVSLGESIVLCDQYGTPLAVMDIESCYKPDKNLEIEQVYGTSDISHPGVKYVLDKMHDIYI